MLVDAASRSPTSATAVRQVRTAFLAAAAVGLLVAVLLGIAPGDRHRAPAARACGPRRVRVAEEGTDAPTPRDDGRDEVGDLARALATMQRELRRQEEARRAFVATASHELRTPLTSLQGTLELLEEDLRAGPLDQRGCPAPGASAPSASCGAWRGWPASCSTSAGSTPTSSLREEPVELGELCRAVAAEFELRADERDVDLDVPAPPGPCWGRGDPSAVARVVRILLDNALRHAPGASTVRVLPAYHGENATVAVDDDGPGRRRRGSRADLRALRARQRSVRRGRLRPRPGHRPRAGRARWAASCASPTTEGGARFVLELPIELPAGSHPEPDATPTPYMS